jgi:glycosyltransferase involved in cell wall biosynthesis
MKLNILVLSEVFYPYGGGGELATFLYSKLLSAAGNNLIVLTNKFPDDLEYSENGGMRIYRIPIFGAAGDSKYSTLIRLDILLTGYLKKFIKWADIVYIPKFWYSAILIAKACHKPVVIHSHGFLPICPLSYAYDISKKEICCNRMPFCLKCIYRYEKTLGRGLSGSLGSSILNSLVGCYFNQAVKLSDAIVTVSESQRSILINNAPNLQHKIKTIYNPLPSLAYTEIEGSDFGYFGGPNIQKGFNLLCQALNYYKKSNSRSIKVHSTCFNSIDDKRIRRLELNGVIAYGKVDAVTYNNIYKKIRAVVVPSVWPEVYGYVVPEAFLRGRLVIASSIGGLPEVTMNCPGALLFRPGDYRELACKMETLVGLSKEAANNLGAQNRAVIIKKYDNSLILAKLMELFYSVIDNC